MVFTEYITHTLHDPFIYVGGRKDILYSSTRTHVIIIWMNVIGTVVVMLS